MTFTAGSVPKASDLILSYTNEAARDLAILSPFVGQRAFLSAPTGITATGSNNPGLPTQVEFVYNGAQWIPIKGISARTLAGGTLTSAAFTATLAGSPGTNPSVSLVTGTQVKVDLSAQLANSTIAALTLMGVAVSGASTIAANDDYSVWVDSQIANGVDMVGDSLIIAGLTPGVNVFTAQYRVSSGTGTATRRGLIVTPQ